MNSKTPGEPPYAIVVGVDFSDASALALQEATRFALTHPRSHVHAVHAVSATPVMATTLGLADPTLGGAAPILSPPEVLTAEMSQRLTEFIEHAVSGMAQAIAQGSVRWTNHLRRAEPAHAIAQLASDVGANLVVVGSHGRSGLARLILGSVADKVVRLAPCPVLVARAVGSRSDKSEPEIEPPCPECQITRQASGGQELWCTRHSTHHDRAHTYHFTPFHDSRSSGLMIHSRGEAS